MYLSTVYMFFFFLVRWTHSMPIFLTRLLLKILTVCLFEQYKCDDKYPNGENIEKNLLCANKIEQSRKKYGNFGFCIVDEKQQTPKMLNRYITIAIFTSRPIKWKQAKENQNRGKKPLLLSHSQNYIVIFYQF